MAKFEVGQKVFARNYDMRYVAEKKNVIPGEVVKVGRKYVYVKLENSWRNVRFRIEPPCIEEDEGGYSPDYVLHTSENAISDYFFSKETLNKIDRQILSLRTHMSRVPDEELYEFSRKVDQVANILVELEEIALRCEKE